MAVAEATTSKIAFNTILAFAGSTIPGSDIQGRWVWGKPPTADGPAAIHIQVRPKDPQVVSLAMQTIGAEDMQLGSKQRQAVFRTRCVAIAKKLNQEAVERQGLALLLKRDGTPTRKLVRYIRDWAVDKSS